MSRVLGCLALWAALTGGDARAEPPPPPAPRGCETVATDLGAARAAGRLDAVTRLLVEAGTPAAACAPRTLFCLGRSAALAHVEAAYAAADAGRPAEAQHLFEAGRALGAPWPLLVGLSDAAEGLARAAHDPAVWAKASLADQQAVASFDDPALCPDEPAAPDAATQATLLRRTLLATLLARPVPFVHDRCAPCAFAVLARGLIDAAHPRPLPITFADGGAALTPEGLVSARDLATCALALRWPRIAVSVHTDDRGGQALNLRLSRERGMALRQTLRAAGFMGRVDARPVGTSEPLAIDDPASLLPAEIQRANRRVDLHDTGQGPVLLCTGATP